MSPSPLRPSSSTCTTNHIEDKKKVRVAGPFTVESLSPHRMLGVDENDELIDSDKKDYTKPKDFASMILENL